MDTSDLTESKTIESRASSSRPIGIGMYSASAVSCDVRLAKRKSAAAYIVALLLIGFSSSSISLAVPSSSPTFATYSGPNAGTLNGVGFTMSGLSDPGFGNAIQSLDLTGGDWNSVGAQDGRIYNANTVNSFTVTFDSPVTGLEMYLYYFRGGSVGGAGYNFYDFGQAFTITGGLGAVTQSATTLDTSSVTFASGVISFTGPVSTLTVSATGSATGGDQGFTFASVPDTGSTAALLGAGVVAIAFARRRLGYV